MGRSLNDKLLFLDGGLGTTLEDLYGVNFSHSTPLWSSHLLISDPETLRKAQKAFSNAGADIILTPTYQASHTGFRSTKPGVTDDEIAQYFQSAVDISRHAGGLVALSLGAYGATLQPSQEYSGEYGDMHEHDLVSFHRARISAFDLNRVDIVAFETLPRLDEIRAVKKIVSKSYWISCVFPNDNKLPDGSTIQEVMETVMAEPRPWGIGVNCVKVDKTSALVEEFEQAGERVGVKLPRLVLYPDGTNGQWYDTTTQTWVGEEDSSGLWHQKMFEIVKAIRNRGKWEGFVIGGCCKTTPDHISELKKLF